MKKILFILFTILALSACTGSNTIDYNPPTKKHTGYSFQNFDQLYPSGPMSGFPAYETYSSIKRIGDMPNY